MTRKEIAAKVSNYFKIQELVCPDVYKKFGDKSWQFLDTELLHTLLVLRTEILNCGMVINDWVFGGKSTQRGLRCNLCQIVKDKTIKGQLYVSAHCNGAAVDVVFGSKSGMTAEKARQLIKANSHLLPYNVRIEKDVTWLHVDVYDTGQKLFEFDG